MSDDRPYSIKTITEFHQLRGLPGPVHPLISIVRFEDMRYLATSPRSWVLDFYAIALKKNFQAKLKYGQQEYDFDEGVMTFMAPGQKIGIEADSGNFVEHYGWLLIFHPDFLWNTPLARIIQQYEYFDYSIHEALFLSEQEEILVTGIIQHIAQEYHSSIDQYTQKIITGQLDVLLNYAQRFYQRQFVTRQISSHDVVTRLGIVLREHFKDETLLRKGLPTVPEIADGLHVSPNYLSALLKSLTGKSTQEHIHEKLIELAKEKLLETTLTVSEIAYALGFDYPQSFSKLFKAKTSMSPMDFRHSVN
jgi:AraC family transcriptional activator of pobA